MAIKVTVAIPIYNAEKYLDYAIRSTLNQSFTNFELLLINDGSTDSSLAIMNSYSYDERVKIINDGQNKGLIYRLNQSIDLAKGKYYARMDADDIMFPYRLSKQIDFLEQNADVDVLGGSAISISSSNEIIGIKYVYNVWSKKTAFNKNPFIHPSVMGRINWFRINKYDENWFRAEDLELWIRTIDNSHFANLLEPILYYRELGMPTISKYRSTQRTVATFAKQHKKYNIPYYFGVFIYLKCIAKSLSYTFFSMINKLDFLLEKRSSKIGIEKEYYQQILNKII